MEISKMAASALMPDAPAKDFVAQCKSCESQIAVLEAELVSIDAELESSSLADVRALNAQKRQVLDDLQFLRTRLPTLQQWAANQTWEEGRDRLNSMWPALVQRRREAVERYHAAIDQLMSAHAELLQTGQEQISVMSEYGAMDRTMPGRGTPIATLLQQVRDAQPARPEVAKIVADPTSVVYRTKVLP